MSIVCASICGSSALYAYGSGAWSNEVKKEEGVTLCPFPAKTEEAGNDADTVTATAALAVVVIKFLREFFELLMVNKFKLKLLHLG